MKKLKRFLLSLLQYILLIVATTVMVTTATIGFVIGFIFNYAKNGFEFATEDFDDMFENWLKK
jgi:hypothetical protein